MLYILFALMIASASLWVIMHLKERRRIVNGLTFLISLASLGALMMLIGSMKNIELLRQIPMFILLFVVVMIPIALFSLITLLVVTGIRVIKREGFNLAHSLSLFLGLGLIASITYLPFFNTSSSFIVNFGAIFIYLSIFYFMLGLLIFIVASILNYAYPYRYNKDFIIVLGAGLINGEVTPLLAGRINKALKLYHRQIQKGNSAPKIIMSGGQGSDEPLPEAVAMRNYALTQGLDADDILIEDKSSSTSENLLFSHRIMEQYKPGYKAVFVTSNYHVFRAALIAKSKDLKLNGRGSWVKMYYFTTATIREYIAVLSMHKQLNLLAVIVIFIASAILYGTII